MRLIKDMTEKSLFAKERERPDEAAPEETGERKSRPLTLNEAELRERLMNDEVVMRMVIDLFVEDMPIRLSALKKALEAGELENVLRQSHTIKGAAATIAAERMRNAALEIEDVCRRGECAEKVAPLVSALEHEFEQLKIHTKRTAALKQDHPDRDKDVSE